MLRTHHLILTTLLLWFSVLPKAHAAPPTKIQDLITGISALITSAVPIIIGLALIGFLWGLATYIFKAGDETAKEEGKKIMLWGVIILFVMVSIWGIVAILQRTFGTGGVTNPPVMPQVDIGGMQIPQRGNGGGCPADGC